MHLLEYTRRSSKKKISYSGVIIVLSGLQEMADITSKTAMAPVTPKATSGKHGGHSEASEGTQFSSLGGFRFGFFYKIGLTQIGNPGLSVLAKLSPFKKGLISSFHICKNCRSLKQF